jgi:hypothetical protein
MKKVITFVSMALLLILIIPSSVLASPVTPGKDIVKYTFVHYQASGKPAKPGNTEVSYSLYKGGVKWADGVVVSYKVNDSGAGVPSNAISKIEAAFSEWDSYTTRVLFADSAETTTKSIVEYDGDNIIFWSSFQQGVIAVCNFWVNNKTKQILEFDIQFNTYYKWDTSGAEDAMDVQNIATHEIGHTLVLNDLYRTQYSAETMYGYSDYGETYKSTLNSGDIAGIRALYEN